MTPFFNSTPAAEIVEYDFASAGISGASFRYYLPSMDDSPGDKPFLLSASMENFMSYDEATNSILMTGVTANMVGNYSIILTLADLYNA